MARRRRREVTFAEAASPAEYVARLGSDDVRVLVFVLAVAYFAVEWIGRRS